jgi:hypothetical protein
LRYGGMSGYRNSIEYRIRQQIDAALKDQYIRSASHIVEIIKRAMDLTDEQPPPVLEALMDFCGEMRRQDSHYHNKEREGVRTAFHAYFKEALKEAQEREDKLFHALTGIPEDGQ